MRLAAVVLGVLLVAACDFTASVEVRCLNDNVPYVALRDTIILLHCSTVDSLALHHDSTRAKP